MTTATLIKRARKPNPIVTQEDIDRAKSGADPDAASYWRWSFRFGGTYYSKAEPSQSQLTQSEYLAAVYALQEEMADTYCPATAEELQELREDWAARINEIAEECREKFDNMREGFQQGGTGELLERRAEAMEGWVNELECVCLEPARDSENEDEDEDEAEDKAEATWVEKQFDELLAIEPDIE